MHLFVSFLAAAAEKGSGGGGGFEMMLLYIVPLVAVMYFVLIRPQKKRERERKAMLSMIKKGDRVCTVGGIHGEVVRLTDQEATLLVDKKKGVEIRVLRSAVSGIAGPKGGEGEGGTQATK